MNRAATRTIWLAAAASLMLSQRAMSQCISGNCDDGYGIYQDTNYRYTGFFSDGNPNGYGILNFASGECYIGQFEDTKFNGQGTYYYNDGGFFRGYWLKHKRHGQGTEVYSDGKSDTDIWEYNEINPKKSKGCIYGNEKDGFSVYIYDDGSMYEGINVKGKHKGWGKLTNFDGSFYEGEFDGGKYHGYGILTTAEDTLAGIWNHGIFEGKLKNQRGCLSGDCQNSYSVKVEKGSKYIGEFKNGQPNGMGKFIMDNGDVYEGSVDKGQIEGHGTITYASNGDPNGKIRYVGDFRDGLPHGYGAMIFSNGDIYYGKFESGEYHGQGVLVNKESGSRKSGIFKNGQLVKEMKESELDIIFGNRNGFGIVMTEDGRYNGQLEEGVPSGHGMLEFYDGLIAVGDFNEGKANGHCVAENRRLGFKYVGNFLQNAMTGRGEMEYADGSKVRGNFKNGELSKESFSLQVAKPEVSWSEPKSYSTSTTSSKATIKICVNSQQACEVSIFDNGIQKVKKAKNAFKLNNSLCDYAYEFEIDLEPGRNEIVARVKNDGGATNSEPRYITWEENDLISNQKRIALVIGNSLYQNINPLKNAANDATLMSQSLQKCGFECITITNVTRDKMREATSQFSEKLAQEKGVGLFYYAGHGIQVDGVNYMVPVEAPVLTNKNDVDEVCYSIEKVMGVMRYAQNDLNIIVLDACRDNPFSAGTRGSSHDGGLATLDAPKGTFIAYATAPGKTALDGANSQNSIYTKELSQAILQEGALLEDVFKQVRREVVKITRESYGEGNEQVPWENSSIFGKFYFIR